jgi:hypothetical protein
MGSVRPKGHDKHDNYDKKGERNRVLTEEEQNNDRIASNDSSPPQTNDEISEQRRQNDDMTNGSTPFSTPFPSPQPDPSDLREKTRQQAIATLDEDWADSAWISKNPKAAMIELL